MPSAAVEYRVEPPAYLRLEGPPMPVLIEERQGVALLDTGAAFSIIDPSLARTLELSEDGTHNAIGATGAGTYPQFAVELTLPILGIVLPSPIPSAPLKENGQHWDAIIGRDVLCQYQFTVDGKTGLISFA